MTEHGSRPARHRPPGRGPQRDRPDRPPSQPGLPPGRRRAWIGVAVAALAASGLGRVGAPNAGTGPVTLNYYLLSR